MNGSRSSPAISNTKSAAAKSISSVCVIISSSRRSDRSTSAPAHGPSSRDGPKLHAVSTLNHTALSVACSTVHDSATACVITPDDDVICPANHHRNERRCSATPIR
jgi:hypothetical protein